MLIAEVIDQGRSLAIFVTSTDSGRLFLWWKLGKCLRIWDPNVRLLVCFLFVADCVLPEDTCEALLNCGIEIIGLSKLVTHMLSYTILHTHFTDWIYLKCIYQRLLKNIAKWKNAEKRFRSSLFTGNGYDFNLQNHLLCMLFPTQNINSVNNFHGVPSWLYPR